jgi:diguanylate cyclase (GGDEF)-like protein/PAS domain S-box-containing protein
MLFVFLYAFAFFISATMGAVVLVLDRRSFLNKLFFIMALGYAWWTLNSAFMISAPDKDAVWFWYKMCFPGIIVVTAFSLHFFLLLTGRKKLLAYWWTYLLIYVPPLLICLQEIRIPLAVKDFVLTDWGWAAITRSSDLHLPVFQAYVSFVSLLSLLIVFLWFLTSKNKLNKKQGKIILFSALATAVLSQLMDYGIPTITGSKMPPFGNILSAIYYIGVLYSIAKYRLMVLTPASASEDILQTMADALLLVGLDGKIQEINDSSRKILRRERMELIGREVAELFPKGNIFEQDIISHLIESGPIHNYEIDFSVKTGEVVPLSISVSPVIDRNQQCIGVVSIMRDITERKQAEERLYHLAHHDPLTKLPNRLLLHARLEMAIQRARRYKNFVGVLLIDLDHFKKVNDTLGHDYGDLLLRSASDRIDSCRRESDTVARMGGDEFIVILTDLVKVESAQIVAKRIVEAFSPPFQLSDQEIYITPSIGISAFPKDGESIEYLLKSADIALYHAKEEGRNNFQFFKPVMKDETDKKLNIEIGLRKALQDNEFVLHYQPLFDMEKGEVAGFEALIRWQHPEAGLVYPTEFIGPSESNGLIVQIGEWVIRTACRQNKRWQETLGLFVPISVNVSLLQFQQFDLYEKVLQILEETKMEAAYLNLEITENIALAHEEKVRLILEKFHHIGVKISIDDFGTGYSSLMRLKQLPVDFLKIDRFFIQHIAEDPHDAAIVKMIIGMAHHMGLKVVAESVETKMQLEFLNEPTFDISTSVKCDQVQGFLLSKPKSVDEIDELLKARYNIKKFLKRP